MKLGLCIKRRFNLLIQTEQLFRYFSKCFQHILFNTYINIETPQRTIFYGG
jgi:hypothetical protein